jgi:hypothetical protein
MCASSSLPNVRVSLFAELLLHEKLLARQTKHKGLQNRFHLLVHHRLRRVQA